MNELLDQDFYSKLFESIISWTISTLPALMLIIVVFMATRWMLKVLLRRIKSLILGQVQKDGSTDQIEKEKRANTLINITRGVMTVSLWLVFILIFLRQLGMDIGPILAGAGIVGLAVGFGAQELVRDAISGFFLLLENRIRTGDVAVVNGTGGLVESINLRTITLRDLSGVVHTFQNGKINTLANMTKDWSATVFDIGVAYKENVDIVIGIVREVGDGIQADPEIGPNILEPLEVFGLDKFGDSAVIVKARFKTKPSTQWAVGREFNKRLKIEFDKKGIEIPFPHQTIYWGEEISSLKVNMRDE